MKETMKTAEEWLTQPQPKRCSEQDVIEWVKQIQLDAIKEGMTRAAEIACKNLMNSHGEYTGKITRGQILTARDNLKEI